MTEPTMPPTPFPYAGQVNWEEQLQRAVDERDTATLAAAVQHMTTALQLLTPQAIGAQPAGNYMPDHPTGPAGLSVLAAQLPADARAAINAQPAGNYMPDHPTGTTGRDVLRAVVPAQARAAIGAQPAGNYMPDHPTGPAGLAVLAAQLPAEARQALGITVDTTVGTRVYIGGVMVYGDTGWRDLRPLLLDGTTADLFAIRRVGDMVTLAGRAVTTSATSTAGTAQLTAVNVPGLAFTGNVEVRLPTSQALQSVQVQALARRFRIFGAEPGVGASFTGAYPVTAPWPDSLPGVPL